MLEKWMLADHKRIHLEDNEEENPIIRGQIKAA